MMHFLFAFCSLYSLSFYNCLPLGLGQHRKGVDHSPQFFPAAFKFLINHIITHAKAMKFKSEYRWLLFILIPFVALLFIHIITPLMLLLNSQPIAISSYTTNNIDALSTASRSYLLLQNEELASIFKMYASLSNVLGSMLLKNRKYLEITPPIIKINNAYEFSKNGTDQNTSHSMWFASGINDSTALNLQQHQVFNNYCQLQPYLIAALSSKTLQQSVLGAFFSYNRKGSQISFHYPSYLEIAYQNITSSIISQPYNLFNNSGNTFILNTSPYASNLQNDSTVSLCQLLANNSQSVGTICIQLRLSMLLQYPIHKFQILSQKNIFYTIQLIQPYSSTVIAQGAENSSQFNLTFLQNMNVINYDEQWAAAACEQSSSAYFFATLRDGEDLLNVAAICLNQLSSQTSTPLLYYTLRMKTSSLSTHLIESYTYSDIVKTLLIPILISIAISIVISVVVLRYILNDLDLQLFKINDYCKFIVEDDITIEIPEFIGTQDIIQIYEEVRIINKLFRYTSKEYFVGYYSNKILKYVEAIHVFKKLNYDPSFLYENIGDAYLYIQEYQKSIFYLKQSIEAVQKEIIHEYGSLERVMQLKLDKEVRFSSTFKQNEVIITRRLWKIFFVYMKYVQLGMLNSKNFFGQNLSEEEKKVKKDRYHAEMVKYVSKLKQIMFPDYGLFAQGTLMFQFEAKFHFSCKNFEAGKACFEKAMKYAAIYSKEYETMGNKIKEKGSKNKFFFKKNKMSGHSRTKPQIIRAFGKNIDAVMKVFSPKNKDYISAFNSLTDGLKSNYISQSVNFLLMSEIKKQLTELKIGLGKFQHTQVFREVMPYKTLHYGPITPDIEPLLYRLPKSVNEVEMRQYVFMYDTASLQYPSAYCHKHIAYMKERSDYIFDKLMKKIDRVSITKFNNVSQIETGCNLTLKDFNQQILKKTYTDYLNQANFKGKTWLINGLSKIILRIKNLQCQKVIVVFLRPIQSFVNEMIAKKLRRKSKDKIKRSEGKIEEEKISEKMKKQTIFPEVGQKLIELMRQDGMRNCKLILMCSIMDEMSQVIRIFGLKDINRRIWAITDGLNKSNNTVYIIDDKHKVDIERLLVSKLANYADNHVFIF